MTPPVVPRIGFCFTSFQFYMLIFTVWFPNLARFHPYDVMVVLFVVFMVLFYPVAFLIFHRYISPGFIVSLFPLAG